MTDLAAISPWRAATGLLMVAAAVGAVGWLHWCLLKRSHDPARLLFRWALTAGLILGGFFLVNYVAGDGSAEGKIGGVILGAFLGLVMAVIWTPIITSKVGEWFGNILTGGTAAPDPTPAYSVAESRRKQGKFKEAVWEIQGQLARFPNDVIGQMMLAEIQVEHLNDLPGAQLTIERFVTQPGHGPKNIAFALTSLADWHLRYAQDVEAARAAFQRIIELLPDTEQSMQAAQRLAHLEHPEAMHAVRERQLIQMKRGAQDLGLTRGVPQPAPTEAPDIAAQRLVRQLEAHPLDTEAREKLAALYSEHFGRLDLAAEQLEQLIAAPHAQGKDVARWLNDLADLQLRHGADYDTVRATLQRVMDQFPGLAAERLARQRVDHLRLELKGKEEGHKLQLGTYEKDLGLKRERKH